MIFQYFQAFSCIAFLNGNPNGWERPPRCVAMEPDEIFRAKGICGAQALGAQQKFFFYNSIRTFFWDVLRSILLSWSKKRTISWCSISLVWGNSQGVVKQNLAKLWTFQVRFWPHDLQNRVPDAGGWHPWTTAVCLCGTSHGAASQGPDEDTKQNEVGHDVFLFVWWLYKQLDKKQLPF